MQRQTQSYPGPKNKDQGPEAAAYLGTWRHKSTGKELNKFWQFNYYLISEDTSWNPPNKNFQEGSKLNIENKIIELL